jgi:beta-aspartyl-peptidase (threonine type)
VGALALDREGRLAAATSTGGMTNKRFGRIGDSPIIGAGNYADDACAVSGTGHGEYFMRFAVAHDICARARYLDISVKEAAEAVIHEVLPPAGGTGGVIALDRNGEVTMPFNTEGMYRGYILGDGKPVVEIYK